MPRPKWYCQTRLTMTRAVSELCGSATQSASTVRRPDDFARGVGLDGAAAVNTDGKPGSTFAPFAWALPRVSTNASRGFGPLSFTTSACSTASGAALSSVDRSLRAATYWSYWSLL